MEHSIYDFRNELNKTCNLIFDLECLARTIYNLSIDNIVCVRLSDIEFRLRNHTLKDYDSSIDF